MISLDSNGAYRTSDGVSSLSFSHTCSGNDRFLEVKIVTIHVAGTSTITINTVTYNGQALSLAVTETVNGSFSTVVRTSIYYLVAPPAGTANVVISSSVSGATAMGAKPVSWNGVDQSSPIVDVDSLSSPSSVTSSPLTLTTIVGGVVSDFIRIQATSDGLTPVSPAISLGESINSPPGWINTLGAEYQEADSVSETIDWTITNHIAVHVAISLAPAGGGGSSIAMRRNLSALGTRAGSRQEHAN